MVKWTHDEERYSRMHSLVIWLSPLVGNRAIFLFSFVIFAFEGSGRFQGLAHWTEHFLTADETTHLAVLFPHVHFEIRVARAPKWVNFFGKNKLDPFPMALR